MIAPVEMKGTCKSCGRLLILIRTPGVKGFTSKHELPMCRAYQEIIEEGKPAFGGIEYIPPKKDGRS